MVEVQDRKKANLYAEDDDINYMRSRFQYSLDLESQHRKQGLIIGSDQQRSKRGQVYVRIYGPKR